MEEGTGLNIMNNFDNMVDKVDSLLMNGEQRELEYGQFDQEQE